MTDLLRVRGLKTWYLQNEQMVRAVDGAELRIPPETRIGLAGQSGSGKTQLVFSVLGLVRGLPGIVGGEVEFDGVNLLHDLSEYVRMKEDAGGLSVRKRVGAWRKVQRKRLKPFLGRRIAVIFQDPKSSLIPYQTVVDHFREFGKRHSRGEVPHERRREGAADALHELGLSDPDKVLDKYPHELSGGQAQRVALALSLQSDPDLLIADEPTSSLDSLIKGQAMREIDRLVETRGQSLLLITHEIGLLSHFVDRIVVMLAGRTLEEVPANELRERGTALHPYTALLRDLQLDGGRLPRRPDKKGAGLPSARTGHDSRGCPFAATCTLRPRLSRETAVTCAEEMPPLAKASDDHRIACWGLMEP